MATPVELPKSGNTVEECLIARWIKRTGDIVSAGDVLAEVETDKATFEITAPVGGTMLATFFDEGALVPVFTTVCIIGTPGEGIEQHIPAGGRDSGFGIRDSALPQSPDGGARITTPAQIPNPESQITTASALSPRARRVASEHGIDAAALAGTGPGGRVLERDVRAAYESSPGVGRVLSDPAMPGVGRVLSDPAMPDVGRVLSDPAMPDVGRVLLDPAIGEHLASARTSGGAASSFHISADASGIARLRAQIESLGPKKVPDVTAADLIAFCAIRALVGASVLDGFRRVAVTSPTPRGLITVSVPDADTLSLVALSARIRELTTTVSAAKGRPAAADNLSGATFTISHAAGAGIERFTPAVAGSAAVLGVGAIRNDAIELSLTCDGRIVDAVDATRFLAALKDTIEHVEYHLILRGS